MARVTSRRSTCATCTRTVTGATVVRVALLASGPLHASGTPASQATIVTA